MYGHTIAKKIHIMFNTSNAPNAITSFLRVLKGVNSNYRRFYYSKRQKDG